MGEQVDDGLRDERSSRPRSRAREWLLVEGNRLTIAGGVLLASFAGFLLLDAVGLIAFQNEASMTRIVGGTIAGVLSLITIVLAINQLVLNPELGNAGQTTERLAAARSLKEDLESLSDMETTPVEPVDFLAAIVTAIEEDVEAVDEAVSEDAELRDDVEGFLDHLRDQTDKMDALLEEATFHTYNEVLVTLHHETSWELFDVRRFLGAHRDSLSTDGEAAVSRVLQSLELFQVAQNYFKTTYVQRELSHVSRVMLFAGMPAIFCAYVAGLLYGGPDGAVIPAWSLPVVVSGLLVIALSPLAIFASYLLRVATLIRRTPHVGPFTTERR